ncbi:phage exonuclease [Stenotrophomonas maltophilia]|uniref:Phage exonuclease n=3 Tax=Bacteria TaxID=2 RepID=A0A246KYI5_9GAMM|nr:MULTISPECIES: phage exonuclease [Stenotrophomonas]EMF62886.1 phage exonuclease, putative [Stenotrophomonas maltophilia EPM1]OMO40590.1 phage exonuclease [Stenotrophomonas sp. MB339]OWR33623.1 phage exonuclease [Stenotrophomonas pavanii]PZT41195.1 phage exonuclease [Stenotrophomonas sepilia]ALA81410.1 phage exonuclease [Stenotrophomonas maltophilia]
MAVGGRMNKRGPLLLIDADVLRYQLAFSNTANIDWNGDGNKVEAIQPERAKAKLEDYIDEIVEKFGARDYLLALSCKKHNFRKDIDPTYKLNRASKDKPALWYVLDEFVYDEFGDKIVEIENLEGDDVLGLLASHPNPKRAPGSRIVVSIDKDMQTIPGIRLYNPNRPDVGVRPISAHDADLFWMKQVLTGDQVDNYPGFPGIGHKGADELLMPIHEAYRDASVEEHLGALWNTVVTTYTTRIPRGGTEPLSKHDAIRQARLARILRYGDYNPKTKEVKLWKP